MVTLDITTVTDHTATTRAINIVRSDVQDVP